MKTFRAIFVLLVSVVLWLVVSQYFFCPSYTFPRPVAFEGTRLYNPYDGIDSGSWYKCNFHAHSNAWNGMTNGEDSPATIWRKYDSLGYNVHCVSEYQKIDTTFHTLDNYVPAYEHGYNARKAHQLVLGDTKTTWFDYFFPQTLSNKQRVLNELKRNDSDVIILNHPQLKKAYHCDQVKYLTNYQCMEVLNPSVTSFPQWDAALSSGHPVFIVGDDDTHHINDLKCIGRECTWLNMPVLNRHNILSALRNGHGYAMHIAEIPDETPAARFNRIKNDLPSLESFSLHGDTISLSVSKPAGEIIFIGQDGKQLAGTTNAISASYIVKQQDHYVRTAIVFNDQTAIYLNPVFRYTGDPLHSVAAASINHSRTVLLFLLGLNILLIWLVIVIAMLFSRRWARNKQETYIHDIPDELVPVISML